MAQRTTQPLRTLFGRFLFFSSSGVWGRCGLVLLVSLLLASPLQAQLNLLPSRIPSPSLQNGGDWLNTSAPLRLSDLRGKFVLLDFWTYCCINCKHMIPELKRLEAEFPNELVVIGVHSAKFAAERETENIRSAVLRYGIEHPVVNDGNRVLWNRFEVDTWPSLRLIDPEGQVIAVARGEVPFEDLERFLSRQVAQYRRQGKLDDRPLKFELEREKTPPRAPNGLSFPGKVLADAEGDRLFIADTGHHRLVITRLDGTLIDVIGSGQPGRADGGYEQASLHYPRGMALDGDQLYVADTENHLIRRVDLEKRQVNTLAGTGKQRRDAFVAPSALPTVELASPWALLVHENHLYIAMAGTHQIWRYDLRSNRIGAFAGNATEDIVDGPLLPRTPFRTRYSSFAQPSGLATDGRWLYVADSEGSSIRGVALDGTQVLTVVGTSHLPSNRLFTFGDRDGPARGALLQHPIGVAHADGVLVVADTYNNKLRKIDLSELSVSTLAGDGQPGRDDEPARFDEPSGVSIARGQVFVADTNNHAIRIVDLASGTTRTLEIRGLTPPANLSEDPWLLREPLATSPLPLRRMQARDGHLQVRLSVHLPAGYKLDGGAPLVLQVQSEEADGVLAAEVVGKTWTVEPVEGEAIVRLPLQAMVGRQQVRLVANYYYCRIGTAGFCAAGAAAWEGTLELSEEARDDELLLRLIAPK